MKADRLTVSLDPGQGAKYRQDRRDLAQRLHASLPCRGRGLLPIQSQGRQSLQPHDEAEHAGKCGLALSLHCTGKISRLVLKLVTQPSPHTYWERIERK